MRPFAVSAAATCFTQFRKIRRSMMVFRGWSRSILACANYNTLCNRPRPICPVIGAYTTGSADVCVFYRPHIVWSSVQKSEGWSYRHHTHTGTFARTLKQANLNLLMCPCPANILLNQFLQLPNITYDRIPIKEITSSVSA